MKKTDYNNIKISAPGFDDLGWMPKDFTGRGRDISPIFIINGLSDKAKSMAIIMNDDSHPIKGYNHWLIWNIPPMQEIPGAIPEGVVVKDLDNAVQGIGYGKHRYRGPKPPMFMKKPHYYPFYVYVLDTKLDISSDSRKRDLLIAMKGHIIQSGKITGIFGNSK